MPEPSATPPPESAAAAAAVSAAMSDAPLSCVRCDYDLRGLPMEGRCPECGVPVEVSQRERRRLADAAVPYVNTLYSGAWLVVIALILVVVSTVGSCIGVGVLTWLLPTMSVRTWDAASFAINLLVLVSWSLGWWWLAAPNPDTLPGLPLDHDRRLVRVMTGMNAALSGGLVVAGAAMSAAAGPFTPAPAASGVVIALAVGALITSLLHYFASLSYAARLALRADDTALASFARQMMWAGPVLCTVGACVIIGPLIAFALYWNVVERLRAHLSAIRTARAAEFGE